MLYAKYFLERLFFNIILIVSRVINIRAKYVIVIFTREGANKSLI